MNQDRLAYLKSVIENDIGQGKYAGISTAAGRHGDGALTGSTGHGDAINKSLLNLDQVIQTSHG